MVTDVHSCHYDCPCQVTQRGPQLGIIDHDDDEEEDE